MKKILLILLFFTPFPTKAQIDTTIVYERFPVNQCGWSHDSTWLISTINPWVNLYKFVRVSPCNNGSILMLGKTNHTSVKIKVPKIYNSHVITYLHYYKEDSSIVVTFKDNTLTKPKYSVEVFSLSQNEWLKKETLNKRQKKYINNHDCYREL